MPVTSERISRFMNKSIPNILSLTGNVNDDKKQGGSGTAVRVVEPFSVMLAAAGIGMVVRENFVVPVIVALAVIAIFILVRIKKHRSSKHNYLAALVQPQTRRGDPESGSTVANIPAASGLLALAAFAIICGACSMAEPISKRLNPQLPYASARIEDIVNQYRDAVKLLQLADALTAQFVYFRNPSGIFGQAKYLAEKAAEKFEAVKRLADAGNSGEEYRQAQTEYYKADQAVIAKLDEIDPAVAYAMDIRDSLANLAKEISGDLGQKVHKFAHIVISDHSADYARLRKLLDEINFEYFMQIGVVIYFEDADLKMAAAVDGNSIFRVGKSDEKEVIILVAAKTAPEHSILGTILDKPFYAYVEGMWEGFLDLELVGARPYLVVDGKRYALLKRGVTDENEARQFRIDQDGEAQITYRPFSIKIKDDNAEMDVVVIFRNDIVGLSAISLLKTNVPARGMPFYRPSSI